MPLIDLAARAGSAVKAFAEASHDLLVQPTLRLGVTGLARSGKTVFTTALIHHLVETHALPAFAPAQEGRLRRAKLVPQPDDDVPRFPFEEHFATLTEARRWPRSTDRISQFRLEIAYERAAGWRSGPATLMLDVVDYPGEWLLDLALIETSYTAWSRATIGGTRRPGRAAVAAPWLEALKGFDPNGPLDEVAAERASDAFKTYLAGLRAGPEAVATTPPGRFLMPGDLAGSPALTFAPLDRLTETIAPDSLAGLMERRFEAYKAKVVTPFFRDHFQRVDRQIVLVDVLSAVDAGPTALAELEEALDAVLLSLNIGRNTVLSRLFAPGPTGSCSPPPRPITSTRRATTGSTRCCGCSCRGPCGGPRPRAPGSAPWRWPPCAPPARPPSTTGRRRCGRWPAPRRPARWWATRSSTATARPRSSRASCPPVPRRCWRVRSSRARCASRASGRRWCGPTGSAAPGTCRRSGSTGRCSS